MCEIRQWFLSMILEAVVVGPEVLKASVLKGLEQTIDQYGNIIEKAPRTVVFKIQPKFETLKCN